MEIKKEVKGINKRKKFWKKRKNPIEGNKPLPQSRVHGDGNKPSLLLLVYKG